MTLPVWTLLFGALLASGNGDVDVDVVRTKLSLGDDFCLI
jgi:hypothetical protein